MISHWSENIKGGFMFSLQPSKPVPLSLPFSLNSNFILQSHLYSSFPHLLICWQPLSALPLKYPRSLLTTSTPTPAQPPKSGALTDHCDSLLTGLSCPLCPLTHNPPVSLTKQNAACLCPITLAQFIIQTFSACHPPLIHSGFQLILNGHQFSSSLRQ